MGRTDACRPRRRGDQGRTAGRGRRYAPLGAAFPAGAGRRTDRRIGLFPQRQPRQEIGRHRPRVAARPVARPRPRRALGRVDREFQGRRPRPLRPRLRQSARAQPRPRLLLDNRLRPDWPLRGARRLRLHNPGDGRIDEPDRRARRPAGRRAAKGGTGDIGPVLRHVCDDRHPGGAGAPRTHRRGPAYRPRAARLDRGHAVDDGEQLFRRRRRAGPHGQRPPQRRSLPALSHRRRRHRRRRGQRWAVRAPVRSGRPSRPGDRPAFRPQRRPPGEPRRPRSGLERGVARPRRRRMARAAGRTRGSRRARERDRRGLRRPPGRASRHEGDSAPRLRGPGRTFGKPVALFAHPGPLWRLRADARPAHRRSAVGGPRPVRRGDRGTPRRRRGPTRPRHFAGDGGPPRTPHSRSAAIAAAS